MRFHHQHGHLAHQHRASSAEQANHEQLAHQNCHRGFDIQANRNNRPDDTARKKPKQHQQHTVDPVLRLNHKFDCIDALLAGITSQLRLRLRTQQILYGDTQETSDDTQETDDDMDSNTDGDDVDKNDSEQEMDYMDDSDEDEDIEEHYSNSPNPSIYQQCASSNTTGVAPISSPSACSQIEEIKDPFVKALTKRHSLTQLHEWLTSIKCSVNTSSASKWITMVASHFTRHHTSQLTVTEPLSTLPFSTQLNRGHYYHAWSGFAKYENFKPWKTKQSFQLRHPHCWFASSPQPQQIRQSPCPQHRVLLLQSSTLWISQSIFQHCDTQMSRSFSILQSITQKNQEQQALH